MEFYLNDRIYEQFAVSKYADLYKMQIAKNNLLKLIADNPQFNNDKATRVKTKR
jgi:hypothetical protein